MNAKSFALTPIRTFIFPALAAACLGLTAEICHAADAAPGLAPPHRTVEYGDLNLANPSAVKTLYQRIVAAATEVCHSGLDSRVLMAVARDQMCRDQSITRAVAAINRPELTALHAVKTRRYMQEATELAKR